MEKLCFVLVLVLTINEALSMSFRNKRQSQDEENNLEDRYGWDRPSNSRPWNNGNQGWNPFGPSPDQRPIQPQPNRPNGPIPWPQPNQQTTRRPNGNGSTTTTQSPELAACIAQCPVTSEYNPVCGTNSVTYNNPGRLSCAQACGVSVSLQRSSPCPTTTTATPIV